MTESVATVTSMSTAGRVIMAIIVSFRATELGHHRTEQGLCLGARINRGEISTARRQRGAETADAWRLFTSG